VYDRINRESIYKILEHFRIPQKRIGLIKATLNGTMVKVKVGNILSREIQVNTGLRQGDALSLIIFNLVMEKVIRMMNISPDEGIKLDGTSISILAYADDIVLLGIDINTVKSLCERLITGHVWKNLLL
jgi:hypothetical protein